MLTKILAISSLGMLLGYLSGYNLTYSSALIKLSSIIIFINLFFIKKSLKDSNLKLILISSSVFILFFIVSSVRGNILKKEFVSINKKENLIIKVYDIVKKDNTQIIKAKILSNKEILGVEGDLGQKSNETNRTVNLVSKERGNSGENNSFNNLGKEKILGNIAIYTFSQEKYIPGNILTVEGKIQNELIILPKKESETYFDQNSGRSFNLLNYWNTRNVNFVSMYPKLKILNNNLEIGSGSEIKLENNQEINLESNNNFLINLQDKVFLYSYNFRNYFYESLKKSLDNFDAGIIMAMLWGDENNISRETNNIFKNTGTSHILVLSGYNLIVVAAFVSFIFRKFSLRKKVIISVLFIIIFLLLAHTSSPVWRASIMSLYTMLTILFLKESNAKLALWITCFIFIIYSPSVAMHDVSFHLSFLATLGIIYFYSELEMLIKNKLFTKLKDGKKENREKYKKWELLISIILVAVCANILIAPYLIFQFGYFKFSSILFSILVTPIVPVIMLLGFIIGSVNIFINIFLGFNIYLLNILSKLILLIIKLFSLFLEFMINIIFNFLKYFSESSAIISNSINFSALVFLYIIIFIIYNYLKFVNKNN